MNIIVIFVFNIEKFVLYKYEYRKFIDIKSRGGSIFLISLIKNNN